MTTRTMRSTLVRVLAVLFSFALLASACGDDDSGDDAAVDTEGDDGGDDAGDDGGDDGDDAPDEPREEGDTGSDVESVEADPPADAPADPVYGGELTLLQEGEHDNWDVASSNCAVSCVNILRLVAEPLFVTGADGLPVPYLVEEPTANDDFTEWTFTLRDGIVFSDGTPADGAALTTSIQGMFDGSLFKSAVQDLTSITQSGPMSTTVTSALPFSNLPDVYGDRLGFLLAPAYWAKDAAARGQEGPIGTGPFTFGDWVPDERLILDKNPNYWRTDDEGRELPFLDRVIVRPVPAQTDREAILQAGDADVIHISNTEQPDLWLENWDGGLLTETLNQQTSYLMMNSTVPPLDNPDARRALALCSDLDTFTQFRTPISKLANGPFAPGSPGHLEDSGFPQFDADAGRALAEQVGLTEVVYGTTNDPGNLLNAQLFTDQWKNNCGIDATIDQFDQGELITRAITGNYSILQWRNHGAVNPASELVWWHSRHAEGALPINFGRITDPVLDQLLIDIRTTGDPAEVVSLSEDLNRRFAEQVHNIWYAWTEWWIPYQAKVQNLGKFSHPDGAAVAPHWIGRIWLHEAWLAE